MEARYRHLATVVLLAALLLNGCGIARKVAVSSMIPVIEETVEAVYKDQDVETVGLGMPSNLLLLRGLCEDQSGNRDLWSLTVQLYFYYAVGFVEDDDRDRAELLYQQGFTMGRRALERNDWFDPGVDLDTFSKRLEGADADDVPLLFWTLANWTKWIAMNLDDPGVLADLPLAEAALDRILQLDAGYFLGMPHLMRGTLEASKPVLTGGDPELARSHFESAFAISDRKLLMFHVFFAQYYCRQQLDEESFDKALEEVFAAPDDLEPDYRLLNEVAKRKATSLMELKYELF